MVHKAKDCSTKLISKIIWLKAKLISQNDQTLDLRKSRSIQTLKIKLKDLQNLKFTLQVKTQNQTCFKNTNQQEVTAI